MPRCPLLAVCSLAAAAAFVPSAKSAAAPIAQADPGALWVADARGVLKLAVPSGDLVLGIGSAAGTRALAIDGTTGQVWAYGGGMLRAFDRQGERLFEVATPAPPADDGMVETASTPAPAAPAATAPWSAPGSTLAVAGAGAVWVADGRQLLAYDAAGRPLWTLRLPQPARGLGLDTTRELLWVATRDRVVAYGPHDGEERWELALGGDPAEVVALAVDPPTGAVWVAQSGRLERYEPDGTFALSVDLDSQDPARAVAADGSGGVWLATTRLLRHLDGTGRVRAEVALGRSQPIHGLTADVARGEAWIARQTELVRVSAAGKVLRRLAFEPPLSILDLAFAGAPPTPLPEGQPGARVRTSGPGTMAAPMPRPAARSATAAPRSSPGAGTTTVAGTVLLPDQTPASGVTVGVLGVSGATAVTAAGGGFSIANVPAVAGQVLVVTGVATASGGQPLYLNAAAGAVAGGTTNLGTVTLALECGDDYASGLFPTNSLNGTVDALVPFGNGLVAAGAFTSALVGGVNTSGVNRVASWNGTTWAKLGTGISGGSSPVVSALAVFGGQLYVGGTFTNAGGVTVANVARWNGTAWSAVGSGLPGAVEALGVWNGALYAGGAFTTSGSVHYNHVAQWNGSAWVPVGAGFDSDVLALTTFDDGGGGGSQLYAGGKFVSGGLNGMARWNAAATPAAWVAVGGGVTGSSTPLVDAFASQTVSGVPALYAGGSFTAAGGVTSAGVARWSGGSWSAASAAQSGPGAAGLGNRVYALAIFDAGDGQGPLLYAAGSFGAPFERLASWDGTADLWQQVVGVAGTAGFDNTAEALAVWTPPGTPAPPAGLYAGGAFGKAGGYTSYRMARWELPATCATSFATPALAVTAPAAGAATHSSQPTLGFAFQAFGASIVTSSLQVQLNNQTEALSCTFTAGTASCSPGSAFADGVYSVAANISDSAGNVGYIFAPDQFTIDTVAPQVAFELPAEGATVPPGQALRLAWSDAGSGVDPTTLTVQANGTALAVTCASDALGAVCTTVQPLPAGTLTLTATVKDRAGNAAAAPARHVTVSGGTTTVTGTVETAAGAPVAGAQVAVLGTAGTGSPGSATSQADGTFSIAGVAAVAGQALAVTAQATVGGAHLIAVAAGLAPVVGGVTAAGALTLRPGCGPAFADGLFPGTGVSGDGGQDRQVQGIVGFNDGSGPALYAWGNFPYAGGQIAGGVARWNGARWQALAGLSGGGALQVADLGCGPALYALGGTGLAFQGTNLHGLAQWVAGGGTAGGTWVPVGGGTDGAVTAAVGFNDGSGPALFVAGSFENVFNTAGGQAVAAAGAARWNGSAWQAVTPPAGGTIASFVVANTTLYAVAGAGGLWQWNGANGGSWTLVRTFGDGIASTGGVAGGSLAGLYVGHGSTVERWNGTAWTVISPSGGQAAASALFGFDDGSGSGARLYMAGTFCAAACATPPAGVFLWDGTAWSPLGSNPDTSAEGPIALGSWNDGTANRLVAAGQFLRTAQGLQANGVEQLIGGVLVPLGSQTVQGPAPDVRASLVYDDGTGPALYVAGRFTSIGGVAANDIARWDGTAWSALGAGIGLGAVDDIVSALEVYDGALYAGGLFSTAGGQPIADLARWDGWTWSNAGTGGPDGWVLALRAWNGFLFAGGAFAASALGSPRLAQWNGAAWSGVGSGIDGPDSARGTPTKVEALAVYSGALYAAGNFSSVSGVAANNVARWSGSAWSSLGDPGSFELTSLAVFDAGQGEQLFMGGYGYDPTASRTASYLASWDGSNLATLGGPYDFGINSLAVFDDGGGSALYLGGSFQTLPDGTPAARFARYRGSAIDGFPPGVYGSVVGSPVATTEGAAQNTGVRTMTVFDDGSGSGPALFLGGDFTGAGGTNSSALAKWVAPLTCASPLALAFSSPAEGATVTTATPQLGLTFTPAAVANAATLAITDGGAALAASCSFGAGTAQCTPNAALATGAHHLAATMQDTSGDTSVPATLDFTVQPFQPLVLGFTAPAENATVANGTPQLSLAFSPAASANTATLTLTDGGSALAVNCSFGSGTAQCLPAGPLAAGAHHLAATLQDTSGNTSAPATVDFTLPQPPALTFTAPAEGALVATATPSLGLGWSAPQGNIATGTLAILNGGTALPVQCSFGSGSALCTPAAPIADGAIHLAATIQDANGNVSSLATVDFLIDTQPPTLTFTQPAAGAVVATSSPTVTLTYGDSGSGVNLSAVKIWATGTVSLAYGCTLQSSGATCLPQSPLGDGTFTFLATAQDNAGNVSPQASLTFTVDTQPPALAFTAPVAGGATNNATPSLVLAYSDAGTGVDVSTLHITANGAALPVSCVFGMSGATCAPAAALPAGSVTLVATVADRAGHVSAPASVSFQIVLDFTPPQITLTSPPPGGAVNQPAQQLIGQLSKPATLAINGTAVPVRADNSFSAGPLTLTEGANSFQLVATDAVGNAGRLTATVTLDTVAPQLAFTVPAAGSYFNQGAQSIQLAWSDAGSGVDPTTLAVTANGQAVAVSCQPNGTTGTACSTGALPTGTVTLNAVVSDRAGNVSPAATVTFTTNLVSVPPAITLLSPPAGSTVTKSQVTLTGNLSKAATLTANGQSWPVNPDLSFAVGPLALAAGVNNLSLVATDAGGATGTLSFTLTLESGPPATGGGAGTLTVAEQALGLQGVSAPPGWASGGGAGGLTAAVRDLSSGVQVTVPVAADGSFQTAIAAMPGEVLRIWVADAAGAAAPAVDVATTGTTPAATDPATVAPPLPAVLTPTPACALAGFYWQGAAPVQFGVQGAAVDCARLAVVHGTVVDRGGAPLAGVQVAVAGQPALGFTLTRADGAFDLVAHGGDRVVLSYSAAGYLPAQRSLQLPWGAFATAPQVALAQPDSQVSAIDLTQPQTQVARGSAVSDGDGTRQATVLFAPGTAATMQLPNGATQPLASLQVRATEYSSGARAAQTLPADPVPGTPYGYVVELSVDAATAAGATSVGFNQPAAFYVENFLAQPVGQPLASAYFDRDHTSWVAAPGGLVVQILSVSDGEADLDIDGSGQPAAAAALAALGVTDGERQQLAALYAAGQSLWRVPIAHFSTWAFAFSPSLPGPAAPQPVTAVPTAGDDRKVDQPAEAFVAGEIESDNQILGESLDVSGTPFTLNYQSDRVPGRAAPYTLTVPISGPAVPANVTGIDLSLSFAGQQVQQSFAPAPSQAVPFTWNGLDGFGRAVPGPGPWNATVSYASGSGRGAAVVSHTFGGTVGAFDARLAGFGGWTLSAQHFYDLTSGTLYYGDGGRRQLASRINQPQVLTLVAGTGAAGGAGDTGPARQAQLSQPRGLAVTHDGGLLIADTGTCRVRKVASDGTIATVAGTACSASDNGATGTGDGGPATAAVLGAPAKAIEGPAPDYPIYIADYTGQRIRKVAANGVITTAAGNGQWGCTGNQLAYPTDLALETSGSILVADQGVIENGNPSQSCDAVVRIPAGGGPPATVVAYEFTPDGDPHSIFSNMQPAGVAAGRDGSVYFTPLSAVLRRPAGGGPDPQHPEWAIGGVIRLYLGNEPVFAGDGKPASEVNTRFFAPGHLAVAPDGSVYVVDRGNQRIRRISPAETVSTVAGGGSTIPAGDGITATQAALQTPFGVAVDGKGANLYISDSSLHQVWKLALPGGAAAGGNLDIPSEDGSLVYVFDAQGYHLSTQTAITGKVLLTFSYSDYPQSGGAAPRHLLTRAIDAFGNATQIQRGSDGTPQAIVGPYGQTTTLQLDANGYLSNLARAGESVQLTSTATGLLTGLVDPRSGVSSWSYDTQGRLLNPADAAGGSLALTLTEAAANDTSVTQVSAAGPASSVETLTAADQPGQASRPPSGVLLLQNLTDTDGLQTQIEATDSGSTSITYPDGSSLLEQTVADPELGALAPYVASETLRLPSSLNQTVTTSRSENVDPGSTFAVSFWTQSTTVNGRTATTTVDNTQRTVTQTSPEGRQVVFLLDSFGRAAQQQIAGIDPVSFTYDAQGRLSAASQGSTGSQRVVAYAYGGDGFLASVTDPLGRVVQYQHDAVGRVTQETLPDGRVVTFGYDPGGDLISVTPPSRPVHGFGFDLVGDLSTDTPPALAQGASGPTAYTYNQDHQLTSVTRPDQQAISLAYDSAGRIATATTPSGVVTYGYSSADGSLTSIAASASGSALSFSYDGPLLTGITATGPAAGTVGYTYDRAGDGSSNFWLSTRTLDGDAANAVSFDYDNDGLLIQAGDLQLWNDPGNGALVGTELGNTGDQIERSELGELTHLQSGFDDGSCAPSGAGPDLGCFNVFEQVLQRDAGGRVAQLTENQRDPVTGQTDSHVYQYTYDTAGRLTQVQLDGAVWETYAYDANGNRTGWTDPWNAGTAATYDSQDRLLAAGSTTFAYSANGELQSETQNGQTQTYTYDVLGNLRGVTLASGIQIGYLVDGNNRRIAKLVNGVQVQGFLYGDGAQPLAQLDATGTVTATFLYATGFAPDALIQNGITYRVVKDHLGSVRWVINADTGEVAQHLDYDAFGRITLDTSPGFQPFGYAGGLYDPQTGLVRFGARDYDPQTGRWTAQDPIGFAGESLGLYTYTNDDPINGTDPEGTEVGQCYPAQLGTGTCSGDFPIRSGALLIGTAVAPFAWEVVAPSAQVVLGICLLNAPICNQLAIDFIDPMPGGSTPQTGLGSTVGFVGFPSFRSFKRALGTARAGRHLHHIVEQTAGNLERFGANIIHSTLNLFEIPIQAHINIGAYYSSKNFSITASRSLTIRQWLSTQSFEDQYRFGMQILAKALLGKL